MYKGLLTHSLLCSEFVELTLNRLIALRNTISLSADFLIVSADALIVATAAMQKAKMCMLSALPASYFFVVEEK